MKNKKDWLTLMSELFSYLFKVFIGAGLLLSFVASMHYMAVTYGNIAYAKEMMFFLFGLIPIIFFGLLFEILKNRRDKKLMKDLHRLFKRNRDLKTWIKKNDSAGVKK